MKKIVSILMALIMVGTLSACGGNQESTEPTTAEKTAESKAEKENSLKPLEILDFGYTSAALTEEQSVIQYGVKIKNPNPNHAIQFLVIYVTAKDIYGQVIYKGFAPLSAIAAGDTITYGGATLYDGEAPAKVEASVSSMDASGGYILQEESTAIYQDELVISDVVESKGNNGISVNFSGSITNTSDFDIDKKFPITAVFYKDGKIIGGTLNYFEGLESGETMSFEIDTIYILEGLRDYDYYEIYAGQ